jgi:outer membrane protein TolC
MRAGPFSTLPSETGFGVKSRPGKAILAKPGVSLGKAAPLMLALLAACASAPDRVSPAAARSPETLASAKSFAAPASAWPQQDWWTSYKDAQLDALINEALAASPSIAQAEARLRIANAVVDAASATRSPSVNLNASAAV